MRLVLQRVSRAALTVDGRHAGSMGPGLVVLAGFGPEDVDLPGSPLWEKTCAKVPGLRLFADDRGRMNLSLDDIRGGLMLVSQFTLHADCRKGRRPSFSGACPPDAAARLFDALVRELRDRAPADFIAGTFGADMDIELVNHGPVTILLDSAEL